jgi:hypothetical protein
MRSTIYKTQVFFYAMEEKWRAAVFGMDVIARSMKTMIPTVGGVGTRKRTTKNKPIWTSYEKHDTS